MTDFIIERREDGTPFEVSTDRYSHVGIYQISGEGKFGSTGKKVFGINWSAKGTCTVEETKEYIALINKAIELVEELNK